LAPYGISRYIHGVQVYLFISKRDLSVLAFTSHPTGANLPPDFAPWAPLGSRPMSADGVSGIGGSDVIGTAIEANGYYVARAKIILTHEPLPPQH
jgi:hypothetical protein